MNERMKFYLNYYIKQFMMFLFFLLLFTEFVFNCKIEQNFTESCLAYIRSYLYGFYFNIFTNYLSYQSFYVRYCICVAYAAKHSNFCIYFTDYLSRMYNYYMNVSFSLKKISIIYITDSHRPYYMSGWLLRMICLDVYNYLLNNKSICFISKVKGI